MTDSSPASRLELRKRAEILVVSGVFGKAPSATSPSARTATELMHELEVHQIELEMQNEELIRAYIELDSAKARYFDLYDMAPVGYCTLNDKGVILEANLAAATLLGVTRSDLVAIPLNRFLTKISQDRYYLSMKALVASGMTQDCELQVSVQSCDPHTPPPWVQMRMSAVTTQNSDTVVRVVFHDISERRRLEAENRLKSAELERAWRLADRASRAKSDFLSSMTHELRSPLNAILGFAQLLNMGSTPPTSIQKSNIDQIEKAGWHLLDLVNKVLDLSLVESGRLAVTLEAVSLAEVLSGSQAMAEPLAQKRGIRIHYNMPPPGCLIRADKFRLRQVCDNLLSNAIQYNREQGRVDITYSLSSPGLIRVAVTDTGEGLSADQLDQLFEPFKRLGREFQDSGSPGTGLVISKHLVERMGGRMGAESRVGTGSNFWFELMISATPEVGHE